MVFWAEIEPKICFRDFKEIPNIKKRAESTRLNKFVKINDLFRIKVVRLMVETQLLGMLNPPKLKTNLLNFLILISLVPYL